MWKKIAVGVFLAAGVAYLLMSGRAQGVEDTAISALLMMFVALSVPLFLYLAVAALTRRLPGRDNAWILCGGIAIAWLLVFAGHQLDDMRVAETMRRGNQLVRLIESHKQETGSYPESLESLTEAGAAIPEPALAGSVFWYRQDAEGGYRLGFPSVAFLYCVHYPELYAWICDD